MAVHNELGRTGEDHACVWLRKQGYTILHRNWRHSYYEIDIIAAKGQFLHFIEVKTRSTKTAGNPEDSVTLKKFRQLQKAADEYLHRHPGHRWIQYDILAILAQKDKAPEFFMLEDVYLQ